VAVADRGDDVAVTVEVLGDAEFVQVVGVLGGRRSDDRGPGSGSELDGEAADAAGRADDQDRFSLGEPERVDARECRDASDWRDAGRGEVDRGGFRRDLDLRVRSTRPSFRRGRFACKTKPKTSSPTA
jgi:hypothetical protein